MDQTPKAYYPTITDQNLLPLKVIIGSLKGNPTYLEGSPYSSKQLELIHELTSGLRANEPVPSLAAPEAIEEQIERLIHDLDKMANELTGKEHAEKLAYFRTKTALLEKLVGLKERIFNLKEVSEFQTIILGFMGEILDKDQRADLMHRLRDLQSMSAANVNS